MPKLQWLRKTQCLNFSGKKQLYKSLILYLQIKLELEKALNIKTI